MQNRLFDIDDLNRVYPKFRNFYEKFEKKYGNMFPDMSEVDFLRLVVDEGSRDMLLDAYLDAYIENPRNQEYSEEIRIDQPQRKAFNRNFDQIEKIKDKLLVKVLELPRIGRAYKFYIGDDTTGTPQERIIIMRDIGDKYKGNELNIITYFNFAYAILADIIGRTLNKGEFPGNLETGSDLNEWSTYSQVYPELEEMNEIDLEDIESSRVGVFKKNWPNDAYKMFNFNHLESNMYCIFTALSYQDKNNYLPMIKNSDDIPKVLEQIGIIFNEDYILTIENILTYYSLFAKRFTLSCRIVLYRLDIEKASAYYQGNLKRGYLPNDKISKVNYIYYRGMKITDKYKKEYTKSGRQASRLDEINKNTYYIALLGNHMFNLCSTEIDFGSEQSHVSSLTYLVKIASRYDELTDRLLTDDILKINQDFYKKYKDSVDEINKKPQLLLSYLSQNEVMNYELISKKEEIKSSVLDFYFIIDFETYFHSCPNLSKPVLTGTEHSTILIYSYSVCPYEYKQHSVDLNDINYINTCVINTDIENKVSKNNEKIVKNMISSITKKLPYGSKVYLYAHYGSRFDNLLIRNVLLGLPGVTSPKSIVAGENNLVSFSCIYFPEYKNNKKYFSIELRDSYKILQAPVRNLPSTYGLTSCKLEFPYPLYQYLYNYKTYNTIRQHNRNVFKDEEGLDRIIETVKKSCKCRGLRATILSTELSSISLSSDKQCSNCGLLDIFLKNYKELHNKDYRKEDSPWFRISPEMKDDLDKYFKLADNDRLYFSVDDFNTMYNKYDVYIVRDSFKKFKEYLSSAASSPNFNNFMENFINSESDENLKQKLRLLRDKNIKEMEFLPYLSNIDPIKYRTISAIVNDIMYGSGVYDNIYTLKGALKKFVQKSVVGGRVQLNSNLSESNGKIVFESKYIDELSKYLDKDVNEDSNRKILEMITEKGGSVVDFDAVSLYPTAIYNCEMPAGPPTVINFPVPISDERFLLGLSKNANGIDNCKFFICCDFYTTVDLDFPLVSEMVEFKKKSNSVSYMNSHGTLANRKLPTTNKSRQFRNGSFTNVVIGDELYKNLKQYQSAVFTKIHCVVLFKEKCTRFSEVTKTLFDLRNVFKSMNKHPCNNIFKLIMNSSYGRTILKDKKHKSIYKKFYTDSDKTKLNGYINKNSTFLKNEIKKIGSWLILEKRNIVDSFQGMPHIGSCILEKSKSIMTNVFTILQNNGYPIYYTDTDSIHIDTNGMKYLEEFVGETMGYFHSDFDIGGASPISLSDKSEKINGVINGDIKLFALKSYFLGKKFYYDKIFGIKNNKYSFFSHSRAKGAIAKDMNEDTYLHLLSGKYIQQDFGKNGMVTKINDSRIYSENISGFNIKNNELVILSESIKILNFS